MIVYHLEGKACSWVWTGEAGMQQKGLSEGCQGQSCSPESWASAGSLVSPAGNTTDSLRHPRQSPSEGWSETSPVRNTFSFPPWKLSWKHKVIAVLGKVQLLSPHYRSQWLPYGVIAQWSHKCLRPNPAIPKEQDNGPTDVSGRLNGLSRCTIRKLTMPWVSQLSIFRKCLLQVRHPNSTCLTGHQAAVGHIHNHISILGSNSLLQ